jgi:two-component system, NarL family, sensor histidine kinase BarA
MWRGISLANKVLLLFGGAIALTVLLALSIPWVRMYRLVDDTQLQVSRELMDVWQTIEADSPGLLRFQGRPVEHGGVWAEPISVEQSRERAKEDRFVRAALRRFESGDGSDLLWSSWAGLVRDYSYARAVRTEEGQLLGLILLKPRPTEAARLLAGNTIYVLSAGFFVLGLAVLVFYLITHQIILSPVRALRETAERVREGDLSIRSDITTGDEFEELSQTFNGMLAEIVRSQDQLRAINSALDVKLNELAEANTALFEAMRLKGEFLANVSHELRTPLNSIIGFAELLRDQAQSELDAGDDSTRLQKRVRYLDNIATASRGLLDLINSLLEMARIEAGKMEVNPVPINLRETCQGVLGLIAPLAERKGLELKLEAAEGLPSIETDPRKFQQIIFNFLSNAVKFTPAGRITLRVETLPGRGPEGQEAEDRVRVSVIDTGPGIAPEDQARLFTKFTQLDGTKTREHPGTGLGLAISKELAQLLQGEIQLVSEIGRGSMFSLILPRRLSPERTTEQRLEAQFRSALAGRRGWRTGEPVAE